MSADLQWLLIRKSNCFIVKALPEGPILSREPGNLMNVHSYKYSGLVNKKSLDISATPEGTLVFTRKNGDGSKVASTLTKTTLRRSTGSRRAAKVAAAETAGKGFRSDLRAAAVSRATQLVKVAHASNAPKKTLVRGPRGKKAAAGGKSAEAKEGEDDVVDLD